MSRLVLGLILAGLLAVSLSACGRKGNPDQPDDSVYPRQYPYMPLPDRQAKSRTPAAAPDQSPNSSPNP